MSNPLPARRRRWGIKPEGGRHFAYADLAESEWRVVKAQADKAGLTMSDYVRRAINSMLLEEGDDVPMLAERRSEIASERELNGETAPRLPRSGGRRAHV